MQTTSYLYRPVLKKAFEIVKKFKNLWFFGLFAVLVSAGGEYEIISRAFYNADNEGLINSFLSAFQGGWQEGLKLADGHFWSNLGRLIMQNPAAVATTLFALVFILTLALFIIWLSVASQIALIKGSSLAGKNKKISIGEGLEYANKNFWPILLIVALLRIALFVLFGLLGWEIMLLAGTGIIGAAAYVVSFIVFVLAVLLISFVFKYQSFYILLKRQKFQAAWRSAWELFTKNWLISLEMALLMFGVYLVSAAVSAFIITFLSGIPLVVIPFYFIAMPAAFKVVIAAACVVLIVIGVLFVTAVMTAFQWAGWTALFERLAGDDDGVSKLERWGENLKQLPGVILGK